jgi:hypothetical protein
VSTQPSILQAQTLRAPLVDSKGILTQSGYWFLYALFQGAQGAEHTAAGLTNLTGVVSKLPTLVAGTHAQRLAAAVASYAPATVWFETDRGVFYVLSAANAWLYAAGVYYAALASIPKDLGAADANFRFGATDYMHEWVWSGSAWGFAPGHGSKYFQASDGAPPLGGLWAPCDGTTVKMSQNDGTTADYVTPDLSGDIFILGGAYTRTRKAAAAPTWDPAAATDPDAGAGQVVQSGAGVTVAAHPHGHALSNANAKINPPSEANGGLPLRMDLEWYVRL